MERLIRLAATLFCGACLGCSCSTLTGEQEPPRESVRFGINTRATEEGVTAGTTYRIMAYKPETLEFKKSGTYILESLPEGEDAVGELTPCVLDSEGERMEGDGVDCFSGSNESYLLVFVSPGIKNNPDGSFDIDMAKLKSEGCRFVASELPEVRKLGPYGSITMKSKMKKHCARVGFDFYKSKEGSVSEFEIRDLRITSAGDDEETVRFHPARRQVEVRDLNAGIPVNLTPSAGGEADADGNPLRLTTAVDDRAAIVAAVYAPPAESAKFLDTSEANLLKESEYLLMQCTLVQGTRETAVVLPLTASNHEILSQRNYIYRVLVKSNYIALSVDVFDPAGGTPNGWDEVNPGGTDDGTVGGSGDTIYLGNWEIVQTPGGEGWELRQLDEQVIRAPGQTEE